MMELVEAINAELPGFAPEHINDRRKRSTGFIATRASARTRRPTRRTSRQSFAARIGKHSSADFTCIFAEVVGIAGAPICPDRRNCWRSARGSRRITRHSAKRREGREADGEAARRFADARAQGIRSGAPAADLIRMKSWLYWIELEAGLAESPKLFTEVMRRFRAVAPVVEMLNAPLVAGKRAQSKAAAP